MGESLLQNSGDDPHTAEEGIKRTVAKGGDCCEDGGVEDSAVIVEADEVEVDDPGGLARLDHKTRQGQDVGAVAFRLAR